MRTAVNTAALLPLPILSTIPAVPSKASCPPSVTSSGRGVELVTLTAEGAPIGVGVVEPTGGTALVFAGPAQPAKKRPATAAANTISEMLFNSGYHAVDLSISALDKVHVTGHSVLHVLAAAAISQHLFKRAQVIGF